MRIGIDARMYGAKATTGIGTYIEQLTNHLFAVDQTNEYVLFLKPEVYKTFTPPNPRVKAVIADVHWYTAKEQLVMPRLLLKEKLDLVHFPHFNGALLYPKKSVVTIHDITPYFFPGPLVQRSLVRRLGYQAIFKGTTRRAKKIITISNHTKNLLQKHFHTPEHKIAVTSLGFESQLPVVPANSAEIVKQYDVNQPYIFYAGPWRDHKNLPALVRAFDIIKKDTPNLQLVLGGPRDDRYTAVDEAIKASPYAADVITPGFVPADHLAALYAQAAIFVLPSFSEGFGLTALEALACGTPVAASNTTSVPEVLQDAAVYFDPHTPEDIARAISLILNSDELRQALLERGKLIVPQYRWEACAQATLQVYQGC